MRERVGLAIRERQPLRLDPELVTVTCAVSGS